LNWPKQYTQTLHCESKEIAYAHVLPFYPGKCKHIHGHNGRIDLDITCHIKELNKRPMIVSFSIAKNIVKSLHEMLDHKFIWALNPKYPVLINKNQSSSEYYITLRTATQKIQMPFNKEDIVLIAPETYNINENERQNYTTSEKILKNFIIPRALEILFEKHVNSFFNNDEIDIDMFDIHGYLNFNWWESKSTNISASFML
jgi:6-pyruvoyl-tetrahydropterin synthase